MREREAEKLLSDAMLVALISLGIEISSGAAPKPWCRDGCVAAGRDDGSDEVPNSARIVDHLSRMLDEVHRRVWASSRPHAVWMFGPESPQKAGITTFLVPYTPAEAALVME